MSRNLRSLLVISVVFVLIGVLLSGCTPKPAEPDPTPKAPEVIKIGAFYPLTGANAAKGGLNKNGTELAVKDINDAGGVLGAKIQVRNPVDSTT